MRLVAIVVAPESLFRQHIVALFWGYFVVIMTYFCIEFATDLMLVESGWKKAKLGVQRAVFSIWEKQLHSVLENQL